MKTRWSKKLGISILLGLGTLTTWGCGGADNNSGDDSGTMVQSVTLTGAVQKGPFVLGSTVNVSPLDAKGSPSGQVFNTKTISDLGEFKVDFMASGLVSLEGSGFYYNEISGGLSAANLTLRALYQIKASGTQNAYINLVTHLTYDRVKNLVGAGTAFATATEQAEQELRTALGIGDAAFTPGKTGIELNILGGDTDANAYLFAVSAVVAQAGATKAAQGTGSVDATIQELLNTTAADLAEDGKLSPALTALYKQAQLDVDPTDVSEKLRARLAGLSAMTAIPELNRVLDSDGDGFANAVDNCPFVANPMQETITNQLCRATRFVGPQPKVALANILATDLGRTGTDSIVTFTLAGAGANAATGQIFPFSAKTGIGTPTDFSLPMPAGVTGSPQSWLYSDVNKDGAADLMLVGSSWMAVYPTNGAGGFGAPQALTKVPADMVGGAPYQGFATVTAADFDGDGFTDLAGISTGGKYLLQRQTAAGAWAVPTEIYPLAFGNVDTRVFAADFNKDGKSDLVLLVVDMAGNGTATVALGNGSGGFVAKSPVSFQTGVGSGQPLLGAAVGDADGDGKTDVMVVRPGVTAFVDVFAMQGDGAGNLAAASLLTSASARPMFGSFTADLRLGLLIPSISYTYFSILNGGNGYKEQRTRVKDPIGLNPSLFDLNHDGILDLVGDYAGVFVTLLNK